MTTTEERRAKLKKIRINDRVTLYAEKGKEKALRALWAQMDSTVKASLVPGPKLPKAVASKLARPHEGTDIDKLKSVSLAAAKENSRSYLLSGVWIQKDKAVATDGRQMFIVEGDFSEYASESHQIPKLGWRKEIKGRVVQVHKSGQLTTLEEGNFPHHEDLGSASSGKRRKVHLTAVHRDMRLADVMTEVDEKRVSVYINRDKSFGFSSRCWEEGRAEINIQEAAKLLGDLNSRFFLNAVRFHALNGNTVVDLYWSDLLKPMMMRGKTTTSVIGSLKPEK